MLHLSLIPLEVEVSNPVLHIAHLLGIGTQVHHIVTSDLIDLPIPLKPLKSNINLYNI
jgi:hypothetical protein